MNKYLCLLTTSVFSFSAVLLLQGAVGFSADLQHQTSSQIPSASPEVGTYFSVGYQPVAPPAEPGEGIAIEPMSPEPVLDESFSESIGAYQPSGPARNWGSVEYLMHWSKGRSLPPLVTTGPVASDGVLGAQGTTVLFGDESVADNIRSGGRLKIGRWLDCEANLGVVGVFMGMGSDTVSFTDTPAGTPVLARPFFDVTTQLQDSNVISSPGTISGTVDARTENDVLAAEIYVRRNVYRDCGYRVDLLGGYQFGRIDDALVINTHSTVINDPNIAAGTLVDVFDGFDVQNEFHGGSLGLLAEVTEGRLTMEMLAKIGFGNMRQTASVSGASIFTPVVGNPVAGNGGLLALPTNIGTYEHNAFAVVPEAGVTFSYCVTGSIELSLGYSFIYWSRVATAGDQVDFGINPTQITGPLVGPARPGFEFLDEGYWVQGLTFGVTWQF